MKFDKNFCYFDIHYSLFDILRFKKVVPKVNVNNVTRHNAFNAILWHFCALALDPRSLTI